MLYTILMVLHVIIAIVLVLVILVQTSKGTGLDGTLGGAATSVLGGQAAPAFLKKATVITALLFMVSCFFLAFHLKAGKTLKSSAVDKLKKEIVNEQTTELPAEIPAATPLQDAASDSL